MGGDGAFKKVAKSRQRPYKERSQPAARVKSGAGLLEKHKDYVLRARAYHSKEKRIKALQEKARFRNPDEFYFKMDSTKTKVRRSPTRSRARSRACSKADDRAPVARALGRTACTPRRRQQRVRRPSTWTR